jgi:hypothetical protein
MHYQWLSQAYFVYILYRIPYIVYPISYTLYRIPKKIQNFKIFQDFIKFQKCSNIFQNLKKIGYKRNRLGTIIDNAYTKLLYFNLNTASDYPFGIFTLLTIVLSVLWFTASDYPFVIFTLLTIVLSVLWFAASDYPFGIFTPLTIVLSVLWITASDYPFVIFTLLTIVLSVLWFTGSD